MTDDKVNVPIKITLDGSDIKKLVEDEFNSVKKEDKTLKRDSSNHSKTIPAPSDQ